MFSRESRQSSQSHFKIAGLILVYCIAPNFHCTFITLSFNTSSIKDNQRFHLSFLGPLGNGTSCKCTIYKWSPCEVVIVLANTFLFTYWTEKAESAFILGSASVCLLKISCRLSFYLSLVLIHRLRKSGSARYFLYISVCLVWRAVLDYMHSK